MEFQIKKTIHLLCRLSRPRHHTVTVWKMDLCNFITYYGRPMSIDGYKKSPASEVYKPRAGDSYIISIL